MDRRTFLSTAIIPLAAHCPMKPDTAYVEVPKSRILRWLVCR